jgi:outer membrane protein assembly factor BamE (lipoprotein component of BamABCDE complex)
MNPNRKCFLFASRTLVSALVASAALAGCAAHPDFLRVGMTRDELDARFGKPSAERIEGDDDVRIYTSQPLGQRASAAHVAADGRVTAVEPLLNTEHFATIRVGTWGKRDIFDHFGKPGYVSHTLRYEVWTYRYREGEAWNSLFNIMFDAEGTVRQTQNEPDPMFDPSAIKRG